MKVVLERQAFLTKLSLVNRNSSGAKTPSGIHKYIYMTIGKEKIIMKNWNGTTLLITEMVDGILEKDGEGVALISLDKLEGVVSSSTTKKITIEETEPTKFKVRANGISTIAGMPPSEFPHVSTSGELVIKTKLERFVKRANMVVTCVGGESLGQLALQGVLWNGDFVATNGSRASIVEGKLTEKPFVLQPMTINLLSDLYRDLGDSELDVEVANGATLIFKMNGCMMITQTMDAKYPNYHIIMEKAKSEKTVTFSRDEMQNILKRAEVFEDKYLKLNRNISGTILMMFDDEGRLKVKIGEEENHSEFVKSAKRPDKTPIKIFLKITSLADCMQLAPEDEVTLNYTDMHHPLYVKQGKWTYLIMPMVREV